MLIAATACKDSSSEMPATDTVDNQIAQPAPSPDTVRQDLEEVDILDHDGHGPDSGTDEAAYSMAHQLIMRSPAYQEDGYALSLNGIEKVDDSPAAFVVDYMYRHYGDIGSFYTGQVQVVGTKAGFVPDAHQIRQTDEVLRELLREALGTDNKNGETAIENSTPVNSLLESENQFAAVHANLQRILGLDNSEMDALRTKLAPTMTFGEWVDLIMRS